MKIYEWNIGMASTIPSNQGYNLKGWIIDEIIKDEPDCIVLTEFVVSRGIEYFFDMLEKNNYHWFISSTTKTNGILIALKETSFDFKETFEYKLPMPTVCGKEILSGINLPDFLEVCVNWQNEPLSIIGIRINVDIIESDSKTNKKAFKISQFKALDSFLSKKHNVLCIGDFNAYWGNTWETTNNMLLDTKDAGYTLHTPNYDKDGFSYVQPDGVKTQLDHLITNITGRKITPRYDWSFINTLRYKPGIKKESPNKPSGLPDHAILKVEISDTKDNSLDNK